MSALRGVVRIAAVVLAVALLLTGIVCLFSRPWFYRMYPLDRITGTIRVTMDGEQYDLRDGDVTGSYGGAETRIGFRGGADGTHISIRGGEYGQYRIMLRVNGVDFPIEAIVHQYNWWNVSRFELDISIDSKAETVTCTSTARELTDAGNWTTEDHTTAAAFSDEKLIHYIVSV